MTGVQSEVAIIDRENDRVHIISYEPTLNVDLKQERARVVTDFYTSQYLLKTPVFLSKDITLAEDENFDLSTQQFSLGIPDLVPMTDELYAGIFQIKKQWNIARKWLIQLEWHPKLPKTSIHYHKPTRDAYKPRGLLLQAYWRLCERCHSVQESTGIEIPYGNGSKWFSDVFWDLFLLNIGRSIVPSGTYEIQNSNLKQARIEIEKDDLNLLKTGLNPFVITPNTGALSLLITASLRLLPQSKKFVDDYWKPYLKSISTHINEMSKPEWGRDIVIEGKHYVQDGRGKGKIFKGDVETYKKYFSGTITE